MIACHPQPAADVALLQLLIRRIRERVGAPLRNVEVRRIDGHVVVRGRADSYYAWQLAIAACHQVLAGRNDLQLDCKLDIDRQAR